MTGKADDLTTLRRLSPITQARSAAFRVMTRHPNCLLDDLLEDIAQAILEGVSADGEVK